MAEADGLETSGNKREKMMPWLLGSRAAGYKLTTSAIDGGVKRSERFLKCPVSSG